MDVFTFLIDSFTYDKLRKQLKCKALYSLGESSHLETTRQVKNILGNIIW